MNATSFIRSEPGTPAANGPVLDHAFLDFRGASVGFGAFRPPEVERMTGFPHALQRLWRCRGHLDERPRYATALYSSLEVAELFVRHRLSNYSIPPPESREIGREAGRVVLFHAVSKFDGACEVRGPLTSVARFSAAFSETNAVAAELCKVDPSSRRFLSSEDGSVFHFSDWPVIDCRVPSYPSYAVLDLAAMGACLARHAGRPLINVQLPVSKAAIEDKARTKAVR